MAVQPHLLACLRARLGHQWKRLGPAFALPGLDPSGPEPDARLCDEQQRSMYEHPVGTVTAALVPADPDLHGEFGAELTRYLIGEQCGLRHQQSDQVVGEQVDPQRLARHLGATAAQGLYAEGSLDA
jgi:hypothetical protein